MFPEIKQKSALRYYFWGGGGGAKSEGRAKEGRKKGGRRVEEGRRRLSGLSLQAQTAIVVRGCLGVASVVVVELGDAAEA